jgi:endo-1,3(4)-beta-glucanase
MATSVSSSSGTIGAEGPFTGILRLVMLAQASHKALLDQYHQVYPTSVGHDYSFTDTTGTLIFNWNTVGDGSRLLMLTWPHHRLRMQNPNFPATTALGYLTTKVHLSPPLSCDSCAG